MNRLPDAPRGPAGLPERRLTSQEFEQVIRRAAELQARAAEDSSADEITEAEALRIGRELGLSPMHLHQALAEVTEAAPPEEGLLDRWLGVATVAASRAITGNASDVQVVLEEYLVRREFMMVLRRLPDRTVFEPASGVVAAAGRIASQLTARTRPLRLNRLEVAIRRLEEGYCYVTLATALNSERAGFAAGALLMGGGAGTAVAVALGIAVAPPAALLGLPVLAGAAAAMRAGYGQASHRALVQLESLLDRLQHGELQIARPGGNFRRE